MSIPGAARRWIDPKTRDYVVERGGPRSDSTRAAKVYLRLATRRGTCAVNPGLGSRLHLIKRTARGVTQRAEAYALECVEDMIRAREIREVTAAAVVVRDETGASLDTTLSFRDTAGDPRSVRFQQRMVG
jgi:phage gp46-like protein